MSKGMDLDEVRSFIENTSDNTRIYIGADSQRTKRGGIWFSETAAVVIIHYEGKHGAKIFGEITTDRDFDQSKSRPRMRLMQEVYKAAELYLNLAEAIGDRECEIHLDLNKDEKHGSSCVITEAIGYVLGMTGMKPKVKPHSWAASHAADRFPSL